MSNKLYVFGIGGTGARVLKSLSFLLASGVECNVSSIVPIIIDPDDANGDVNKTVRIIQHYQSIRSKLSFEGDSTNKFFNTEITSLNSNFRIKVEGAKKKFKDFIEYQNLNKKNRALTSLLFSKQNLNAELELGFKGNPNMGSVVLNQFSTSEDFEKFVSSFTSGDRIFIISSIFGGTGAAGFPLLLKNIRSASPNLDNYSLLRDSTIGAVSVLPYFGVKKDGESDIEKSTFISKTKAALRYYEHNVNDSVNLMYYLGDQLVKDYENIEGSVKQENQAHFVELISALSILDFANENDFAPSKVKEFGIKNETQNITFKDLSDKTRLDLIKPLSRYYLFQSYYEKELRNNLSADFAKKLNINERFLTGNFNQKMERFNNDFRNWLQEMSNNKRGFTPFSLDHNGELLESIKGYKPKNSLIGINRFKNFQRVTASLDKKAKNINMSMSEEKKLMEVFNEATQEIIVNKFNL